MTLADGVKSEHALSETASSTAAPMIGFMMMFPLDPWARFSHGTAAPSVGAPALGAPASSCDTFRRADLRRIFRAEALGVSRDGRTPS